MPEPTARRTPADISSAVVIVDRIDSTPASRGRTLYVVSGRVASGLMGQAVQFTTHDEEKRRLCAWAANAELPVRVRTRKRGWGYELLEVAHVGEN